MTRGGGGNSTGVCRPMLCPPLSWGRQASSAGEDHCPARLIRRGETIQGEAGVSAAAARADGRSVERRSPAVCLAVSSLPKLTKSIVRPGSTGVGCAMASAGAADGSGVSAVAAAGADPAAAAGASAGVVAGCAVGAGVLSVPTVGKGLAAGCVSSVSASECSGAILVEPAGRSERGRSPSPFTSTAAPSASGWGAIAPSEVAALAGCAAAPGRAAGVGGVSIAAAASACGERAGLGGAASGAELAVAAAGGGEGGDDALEAVAAFSGAAALPPPGRASGWCWARLRRVVARMESVRRGDRSGGATLGAVGAIAAGCAWGAGAAGVALTEAGVGDGVASAVAAGYISRTAEVITSVVRHCPTGLRIRFMNYTDKDEEAAQSNGLSSSQRLLLMASRNRCTDSATVLSKITRFFLSLYTDLKCHPGFTESNPESSAAAAQNSRAIAVSLLPSALLCSDTALTLVKCFSSHCRFSQKNAWRKPTRQR